MGSASSCGASNAAELPPQPARRLLGCVWSQPTQQRPPFALSSAHTVCVPPQTATSAGSCTAIDPLTKQQESRLLRHWSLGPLRDHSQRRQSSAQVDSRHIQRSRSDERTAIVASASSCGASNAAELTPQLARRLLGCVWSQPTQQRPPFALPMSSAPSLLLLT